MLRWLTVMMAMATIAVAFAVTWIKLDTRQIEARLQAQRQQIEKAEGDIAILRAELGYLTRPDRLEPLARRYLGLAPVTGSQIIDIGDLPKTPAPPPTPLAASVRTPAPNVARSSP